MIPAARQNDFGSDPIVVAYGVGVDSTAMLIGLRDRRIPVGLILFSDTGSEKPATYAYLPVIQDWLARQGMPPVTVLKRNSPRRSCPSMWFRRRGRTQETWSAATRWCEPRREPARSRRVVSATAQRRHPVDHAVAQAVAVRVARVTFHDPGPLGHGERSGVFDLFKILVSVAGE